MKTQIDWNKVLFLLAVSNLVGLLVSDGGRNIAACFFGAMLTVLVFTQFGFRYVRWRK